MASNRLKGAFKNGYDFLDALSLVGDYLEEPGELTRCLEEVGDKRKKALEREWKNAELVSKHRTILTSWSEDDRYADDRFYQKKLLECYDVNRKLRRAMGLP